jgi:hypothetical protein
MKFSISEKIITKLANKIPPVSQEEIEQCFATRDHVYLKDERENNRTIPPTLWFISDTFMGRKLKITFIQLENKDIVIKTAYEPNKDEVRVYRKYAAEVEP